MNPLVDGTADGRAEVRSILLIVAAGPPAVPVGVSAITQQLVKTGDGWRVEVRAVSDVTSGPR